MQRSMAAVLPPLLALTCDAKATTKTPTASTTQLLPAVLIFFLLMAPMIDAIVKR
jgi:hypothetical protein